MAKNRCSECNIKVGIEYFNCSCDPSKLFCSLHRFPFSHSCSKDCLREHSDILKKENPVIKSSKIIQL
jgi:hypothetical protein